MTACLSASQFLVCCHRKTVSLLKLLTRVISLMYFNHLNLDMWVFCSFFLHVWWFTDYSLAECLSCETFNNACTVLCLNGVCVLVSLKNTGNRKTSL